MSLPIFSMTIPKRVLTTLYTNNPDGFTDWGVINPPDSKCKHSIIHSTLNFSVYHLYPTPEKHEIMSK